MSEYFSFEKQDEDLPFYRGETVLSWKGALLLLVSLILFTVPVVYPIKMSDFVFSLYSCFILLIPTVYLLRGKLNLLFKRIKRGDIKLIVLCLVLSLAYSLIMIYLLKVAGIASGTPIADGSKFDLVALVGMIFQLMGEELYKILILLLSMFVLYRFSSNRKVSLIISLLISMLCFGFLHAGFYGGFVQVFMVQGLGSIFDFYAYFKTRNIMVTYVIHLIFDLILSVPI